MATNLKLNKSDNSDSGGVRNERNSTTRSPKTGLKDKKTAPQSAVVKSPRTKTDQEKNNLKNKSSVTEKGILKNKKNTRAGEQTKKSKEKKKKPKPRKKSFYEKVAQNMGFYVGNVVLRDPRAIEAAQALDLQQKHLRRLRVKFDKIDIDGSGNIDYDEFFESVGETRSPFTDKLFSVIG